MKETREIGYYSHKERNELYIYIFHYLLFHSCIFLYLYPCIIYARSYDGDCSVYVHMYVCMYVGLLIYNHNKAIYALCAEKQF